MTAAVYIVGGNRDHEELRYSLRSVATNAPDITSVWIVGHIPAWVTGVRRIELEPLSEKWANMRQSLTAYCTTKGAPVRFYSMQEDFYVIEPATGQLPTIHRGPASEWLTNRRIRNTYTRCVKNGIRWLRQQGYEDFNAYIAHTPLLMDRHKMADVWERFPTNRAVDPNILYPACGVGGVGARAEDSKVKKDRDLDKRLAQDMPYLSGNQNSFNSVVGDYLKDLFPTPCKYEK